MKIISLVIPVFFCSMAWSAKPVSLKPNKMTKSNLQTSTKKDRMVLTGVDAFGPGEKVAYAKVIQTYRKENLAETRIAVNTLLKFYPRSVYADNALYLQGILQMKKGQTGHAIKSFDQVIQEYKKGNKRASAMFAKSVAYKRLNLKGTAKKYLKMVMKNYPGSVESQRAWMELRLMKAGKG